MTNGAASLADVGSSLNEPDGRRLLVIADEHSRGYKALALPFRDATVLDLGIDPDEVAIEGAYDTVVVDRHGLDLVWLSQVADRLGRALRPSGEILVTFDATAPAAAEPSAADLAGLAAFEWHGLRGRNGRVFAVLRPARVGNPPAVPVVALLAAVDAAVRLAGGQEHQGSTHVPIGTAKAIIAQYLEDQRRSEHALLDHLVAATAALEIAAADLDLREMLRRTARGRRVLGVVRKVRHRARRVTRKAKPAA